MNWKMVGALLVLVFFFEVGVTGQNQTGSNSAAAASALDQQQLIARGKYLTHDVAMCVVCHSPKDDYGRVIKSKEFQGASMPVSSPFPKGPRWATNAPSLTSIVAGNEEGVFQLLTTGNWPSRQAPLPPMPPFRLNEEDARAIIAYLKSI